MLTVFKYPVSVSPRFSVGLPRGAEILSVQIQHGDPKMWALVNPDHTIAKREFALIGTGGEVPDDSQYIGTFNIHDGRLVLHLFELRCEK